MKTHANSRAGLISFEVCISHWVLGSSAAGLLFRHHRSAYAKRLRGARAVGISIGIVTAGGVVN